MDKIEETTEEQLITKYFKVLYKSEIVELKNETDSIWYFKIKMVDSEFKKIFGESFEIYNIDFLNKTIGGMIDSKKCEI